MVLKFLEAKWFLSYRSKQSKCCLDQELKKCLAYLNFNAIFEFLGQCIIRCILFFKRVLMILR